MQLRPIANWLDESQATSIHEQDALLVWDCYHDWPKTLVSLGAPVLTVAMVQLVLVALFGASSSPVLIYRTKFVGWPGA